MQIKVHHRSVYAPIRYEATRPYAASLGKLFIAHARQGECERMRFVFGELFTAILSEVRKMGKVDSPGPGQAEIVNVQVFGHFQASGKIIFDVSKPLAQSLLMTDAEDIPCSELFFPAESFYLHFGSGVGLVQNGVDIEGAFVTHFSGKLIIDLASRAFGNSYFYSLQTGESLLGASIDILDGNKSIAQALSDSIRDVSSRNQMVLSNAEEFEAKLADKKVEVVKQPSSVEQLTEKIPLLKKALNLVVNTLFYLVAEPDDLTQAWGQDVPSDVIASMELAPKLGTKKTIENTLAKAGYLKVRYVGRRFAESQKAQEIGEALSTGRILTTHIRRGHFRQQAYGAERALRKTIFVAPVVVNAANGGEMPGRIYDVVDSSSVKT